MFAFLTFALTFRQPTVSLEIRGERLSVAAPKIAQALGMEKLTVYAPLTSEVAAIRVFEVQPSALKQKIEQAFHGTFIQKDEAWTFEQTIEQKVNEKTFHFERLAQKHRRFIDAAKKFVASAKPLDAEQVKELLDFREKFVKEEDHSDEMMKEAQKVQNQTPASRFAIELVAKLTPTNWRQVDVDDRRSVFSIRPTNVQLPMPVNLGESLANLISRQNLYSKIAIARFSKGAVVSDLEGASFELGTLKMDDFAEVNVILQDSSVTVMGYTAMGELKFRQTVTERTLLPDELDAAQVRKKYAKFGPKLSPLAEDYLSQIDQYYKAPDDEGPSRKKPISTQLRAALLNPIRVEPLSIAVPEVLLGSNPKLNIVANLNEDMVAYRNLSAACLEETPGWVGKHDPEHGWLTIELPDAFEMRKQPRDRTRMAQVFQLFGHADDPTVEQQADYARELTVDDDVTNLCYLNLMLIIQRTGITGPADPTFLNLYGSMSLQDRANARTRPISIALLSQPFLWTLADCVVYEKRQGLYSTPKMDPDEVPPGSPEATKLAQIMSSLNTGFSSEPTYRHPNGLTPDMTVGIKETDNFLRHVKFRTPVNGRSETYLSPSGLGLELLRKEFPSKYPATVKAMANYDLSSLKVTYGRAIILSVSPGPAWEYVISHHEPLRVSKQTYSPTSLPSAVQKMVDEGYKMAKVAHEAGLLDGTQRDIPPCD